MRHTRDCEGTVQSLGFEGLPGDSLPGDSLDLTVKPSKIP